LSDRASQRPKRQPDEKTAARRASNANYVTTNATYVATNATYVATNATYVSTNATYVATNATYVATHVVGHSWRVSTAGCGTDRIAKVRIGSRFHRQKWA
jgi:hypothetical protein